MEVGSQIFMFSPSSNAVILTEPGLGKDCAATYNPLF